MVSDPLVRRHSLFHMICESVVCHDFATRHHLGILDHEKIVRRSGRCEANIVVLESHLEFADVHDLVRVRHSSGKEDEDFDSTRTILVHNGKEASCSQRSTTRGVACSVTDVETVEDDDARLRRNAEAKRTVRRLRSFGSTRKHTSVSERARPLTIAQPSVATLDVLSNFR